MKPSDSTATVSGSLQISTAKQKYKKGETIEVIVSGRNLAHVNAFSFALPYNQQEYEYEGVQLLNVGSMENFSNDRLHSNGDKVLYPTFVNLGDKTALDGTDDLFIIKLKARQNVNFNLVPGNGILVDKQLRHLDFTTTK